MTAADVAVTVADDETASTGVTLTVSDEAVGEDAGATAITVTGTLNGAPGTSDTAVTVTVSGGTASAGDFAAVQDFTLTIGAGQASGTASFTLTPVDDAIDEGDETVRVAGAAQGLEVTPATVTIEDDDARGVELSATALTMPEGESRTYTVVLSSQPAGPVTVTPLASGSPDVTLSPSALTFTAESWNAAQTVTVSAAQDADAEDDAATISHAVSGVDYASVTAGDVAVTVSDDDTRGVELSATALTVPEGESWTYTVMLSSQPSGPVTVTPALKAGSSSDVTVSAVLTFTAADWDRAQTVTVSAAPDADAANDRATVSHAVSGGGYGSVAAADVAVTVADDETASTGVTLTVSDEAVGEDAGATAITVTGTLNGAPGTSDRAVTVSVSGGTASAGDFAAVQDFTLTIGAGQASGTASFTLTPVDDAIDEGDETVRVAGAAQGLEVTPATVTIEDDDARGIAVSATVLTVPEGGGRTYTVALASQPTGTVTVTPSVSGSPDVTVSPSALTFTAETWNVARTVTVSAAQDADAEDDAATISHAVAGGDYGSVTAGDVAVTVSDDDTRGVELSATALTVPEGESWTYTVMLSSQPAGPVTVTPSVSGSLRT